MCSIGFRAGTDAGCSIQGWMPCPHVARSGALLPLISLIAGCQSAKSHNTSTSNGKGSVVHPADTQEASTLWNMPDTDGPAAGKPRPTADMLAQMAQQYANNLQPSLAKRAASQPAVAAARMPGSAVPGGAVANRPTEPSGVQFNTPPGQSTTAPGTSPGEVSTPGVNTPIPSRPPSPRHPPSRQTPPRTRRANSTRIRPPSTCRSLSASPGLFPPATTWPGNSHSR